MNFIDTHLLSHILFTPAIAAVVMLFLPNGGNKLFPWFALGASIILECTRIGADGRLEGTGETFALPADIVFKAIGQEIDWDELGAASRVLRVSNGRIGVDAHRKTSLDNVWAGGDCVAGGQDLTFTAVQDGKIAAQAIDRYLRSGG